MCTSVYVFAVLLFPTQILSNFGVDVLEALSSTCTLFTQSNIGLKQLLCDLLVAFLLITAHGSVLMCQVGLGEVKGLLGWLCEAHSGGFLTAVRDGPSGQLYTVGIFFLLCSRRALGVTVVLALQMLCSSLL